MNTFFSFHFLEFCERLSAVEHFGPFCLYLFVSIQHLHIVYVSGAFPPFRVYGIHCLGQFRKKNYTSWRFGVLDRTWVF